METINQIKIPRVYNIVIFESNKVEAANINKVFGDIFGYDFIYAAQKMLEMKNAGKIEIGLYSLDIAMTLLKEIKSAEPDIVVSLSEVRA